MNTEQQSGGRSLWDLLIVVVVVAALVGLTIFLVQHYTKASDTATILGIVVPAFAAIFGITLGYATGSTSNSLRFAMVRSWR